MHESNTFPSCWTAGAHNGTELTWSRNKKKPRLEVNWNLSSFHSLHERDLMAASISTTLFLRKTGFFRKRYIQLLEDHKESGGNCGRPCPFPISCLIKPKVTRLARRHNYCRQADNPRSSLVAAVYKSLTGSRDLTAGGAPLKFHLKRSGPVQSSWNGPVWNFNAKHTEWQKILSSLSSELFMVNMLRTFSFRKHWTQSSIWRWKAKEQTVLAPAKPAWRCTNPNLQGHC